MAPKAGDLEVWWVQNPPHEGERFPVTSVAEAIKKLDALAEADLQNRFVWGNAGGLEVFTEDYGWEEYYDEEDRDVDQIAEATEGARKES